MKLHFSQGKNTKQRIYINGAYIDEEREILFILAPQKTSKQIMEDVNREFGLNSKANGIITAVPTEKAYKI